MRPFGAAHEGVAKIKLHIPPEGLAAIRLLACAKPAPRRCAWSSITRTPATASAYCCAAKRRPAGRWDFAAQHQSFGAWIECDSLRTKQRVEMALVTAATGLSDQVKVEQP